MTASSGPAGDITELLRACLALLRLPEELAATYQPRLLLFWIDDGRDARMLPPSTAKDPIASGDARRPSPAPC